MFLKKVRAKKIKDSRGDLTIEVSLENLKSSAPSGKSTGKYETKPYYKSLENSIKLINSIEFNLEMNSFDDLQKIEKFIKQKFKFKTSKELGANTLFALESLILKKLAREKNKQVWQIINSRAKKFPIPIGNAVGGGLHSEKFSNAPIFQEFEIIPSSKSPSENINTMNSVYKKLKKILNAKNKNDEGAWQCSFNDEKILEVLNKFSKQINLGLDIAANSFYKKHSYSYKNKSLDRNTQILFINSLIKKFNLLYIEDPLQEEDFEGFSRITRSPKHLIVGDDLTATQIPRLKKAIAKKSINAMIVKPNQNGSLIELKEIFSIAKKNKIKTIISHRSGETLDTVITDLAFGFQSDFIKAGISTKWREVKLDRLIEIEKM